MMNRGIKILYLGNKLMKHGKNPTGVEFTGAMLEKEYEIISASDYNNPVFRMIDIILKTFWFGPRVNYIMVDTYSTSSFYVAVIVSLIAQLYRKKYIPVLHGGELATRARRTPRLGKLVFGNSHENVAPSNYLVSKFAELNYEVTLIPNSLPLELYKYKKRTKITPRMLYVRAFHEIYNPTMAIEVLHKVKQKYPDAELCMVGPDKDGTLADCQNLAEELKVDDSVKYTGQLPKSEWIKLAEEYDIFINTTNFDNTPISVMEAMALGMPVASTDASGLPYLLEHEKVALLSIKGCGESMASNIIRLLKNQELVSVLTSNGRKQVEGYEKNRVLEQWKKLLK